jgi:hypothetical protein
MALSYVFATNICPFFLKSTPVVGFRAYLNPEWSHYRSDTITSYLQIRSHSQVLRVRTFWGPLFNLAQGTRQCLAFPWPSFTIITPFTVLCSLHLPTQHQRIQIILAYFLTEIILMALFWALELFHLSFLLHGLERCLFLGKQLGTTEHTVAYGSGKEIRKTFRNSCFKKVPLNKVGK